MEWTSKVPYTLLVPSSKLVVTAEGPAKGKSLRDALATGLSVNCADAYRGSFGMVMRYKYNGADVAVKELLVNPVDNGALGTTAIRTAQCLYLSLGTDGQQPLSFSQLFVWK